MKRILIIEISNSGHHPGYLRHILQSIVANVDEVIVAGIPELLTHPELTSFQGRFTHLEIKLSGAERSCLLDFSPFGLMRRELCVRRIYARAWREASKSGLVDTVILPFADECLHAMALLGAPFGRSSWVGITMRTRFHLARMGVVAPSPPARPLREWLFRRMLKQPNLSKLLSIDPTLVEFAAGEEGPEFRKVNYLPDPSDTLPLVRREKARENLDLPAHSKIVLVYGALSERKGIFQLIRAMARSECPESIHLLLAGSSDDGVNSFLDDAPAKSLIAANRLHIISGYIPQSRVSDLVHACDAMWIGYLEFYTMSNVLVLAARHMLPCITSREGIVGYLSTVHGFGMTVDPRSEQSIVEVLQKIAHGDPSVVRAAENARPAFSQHSYSEFYRVISDSVQAAEHNVTVLA